MKNKTALDINTTIYSKHLILEPIEDKHASLLHPFLQDPRIYTWISSTPPDTIEHLKARWAKAKASLQQDQTEYYLNWAVRRTADGIYLGKLDADIHMSYVATNIGYLFFPDFWGKGYAREAVNALVAHLSKHGISEQHATVTDGNIASCRLLEAIGFQRISILPGNDIIRGQAVDDIEYIRRSK